MIRPLVSLMAVALVTGCATPEKAKAWRGLTFEENQDRLGNEIAMQRSGQAVVHEAYVRNGVIVTPARNWMYGQTDSYVNAPIQTLNERDWLSYASAQYGGVMTGEVAERAGTGRSAPETEAIERLTAIGRFKARGNSTLTGDVMAGAVRSPINGIEGLFDPNKVVTLLAGIDPSTVQNLPAVVPINGLRLPTPKFDLGKADLKLADSSVLAQTGKALGQYNGLIVVAGFTDPSGTETTNVGLADRRAQISSSRLEAGGVSPYRLAVTGKPLCCYLNDNATESKRAQNRRAEIRLGGAFARVDARQADDVAAAIAQAFKAIGGDESRRLVVYGVSPNADVANALGILMKKILVSEAVGHRNAVVGDSLIGAKSEVIIEVGI